MKKILIIRPDAIGDFIIWLYTAGILQTIYPRNEYHITLLGNRVWCDLARRFDYWDDVWELDRHQFLSNTGYRWSMWRRLRQYRFDIVIHPVFSREFLFGDSFVFLSSAKERIGFAGDTSGQSHQ